MTTTLALMLLLVSACNHTGESEDPTVARAYGYSLTRSELEKRMPENYSHSDSTRLADQIVNAWIRDKVVLNLAEKNLSEAQKDFSTQLNDYRNSLLAYAYEKALLRQKLDTVVGQKEISEYYEKNIQNFKLESAIVRLRFIKLNTDAPDKEDLEDWFRSEGADSFQLTEDYCRKYAENYFLDNDKWLYLDDFLKEVPLPVIDWENFLVNTEFYSYNSGTHLYLVRFYDFKLRGDTPPEVFVARRIKELILNKRKVDMIKEMREQAVSDAYANNQVQWNK